MNILVVEDEPVVQLLLKESLTQEGHAVTAVDSATEALDQFEEYSFDLILLDLNLADGSGKEVCNTLRQRNKSIPIVILSADTETKTKVECLNMGADDYLTKPFDSSELKARIDAVNRRAKPKTTNQLLCGELLLDLSTRKLIIDNEIVELTNNEFKLLKYMMNRQNTIIPKEQIAEEVWELDFDTQTNYVNVYISYIRKKIREHTASTFIKTIRGKGFVFHCED